MSLFQCVVVATDFSPSAERAVERAVQLAVQHGSELHLLHVVRPLDLYPALTLGADALGGHEEALRQAEHARVEAAAAALAHRLGLHVRGVTRLGRAHVEIAAYVQSVAADLVVVGARGENSLLDLLMGATASRVLRLFDGPVLIVRQAGAAPYRRVLAAVDLSPASAEVVRHAAALAGGAGFEVAHVLGSEVEGRLRRARLAEISVADWLERQHAEAGRRLDALLAEREAGPAARRTVLGGLPSAAICRYVEDEGVDVAVLGRHGHGAAMQDWMLGSVSQDVAFAVGCDVLLVRSQQP